jgi:preprotein translocase subunit SecF
LFELIKPDTRIDFVRQTKWAIALSLAIVLLAAGVVATQGVRLGLDFTGGIEVLVRLPQEAGASEESIREVLGGVGLAEADVVRFGEAGSSDYAIRSHVESAGEQNEMVDSLRAKLAERFGGADVQRVDFIGPKVGAELRRNGLWSVAIASLLLLVYIGIRFTPIFAPSSATASTTRS